jgi:hypothetical protein
MQIVPVEIFPFQSGFTDGVTPKEVVILSRAKNPVFRLLLLLLLVLFRPTPTPNLL